MAQLVYETTDPDFADRAITAFREADISCHRLGQGYHDDAAHLYGLPTESQISIYIERDTDYMEANRILISLGGAVVERSPPLWIVLGLIAVAAIVAILAAVAWAS